MAAAADTPIIRREKSSTVTIARPAIHLARARIGNLPRCQLLGGFQQRLVGSHPDRNIIHIDDVLPTPWCLSYTCSIAVTPGRSYQSSEGIRHVVLTTQAPGAGCRAGSVRGELHATRLGTGSHHRAGSLIQERSGSVSTARNDSSSLARCGVHYSNRAHPHWAA
jgi:hypothetical protein